MTLRARAFLAGAPLCVVLRMGLACSTSTQPAASPSDGAPSGPAVTACQIQGYISELEGGVCPVGTCLVRAFDTNGGLLPCCTSVVSGPGMCIDADATDLQDSSDATVD